MYLAIRKLRPNSIIFGHSLTKRGPLSTKVLLQPSRRGKADVPGATSGEAATGKDIMGVYNLRFDDFGKRFDDLASRITSSDRFLVVLTGVMLGSIYYNGNKIDKMGNKLDKRFDDLEEKFVELKEDIHNIKVLMEKKP